MLKKLTFVLLLLISMASFAGPTTDTTGQKAVPTPTEKATQIINGQASPYPDILKAGKAPRLEDFVRPGMTQHRQMITP